MTGIDDYFAAGHSLKDFDALPRFGLDAPSVEAMRCAQFDLTEAGLADRFTARHGRDHRHDYRIGEWFSYTPQGYRTGKVEPRRAMRETVESLKGETLAARGTDSIRDRKRFELASGGSRAMNAALAIAADDKGIEIDAGLFDSDADLIGMQNGVLRLSTGILLAPSRELLVTKATTFRYDPRVRSKLWEQVISRATGGDAALLRHVQEILGTLILGRADRGEVFLVHGPSATAKTVVLETFVDGLGSDYAVASKSGILMKARQPTNAEAATPFLISLRGKRFVACSELDQGETVSDSTLKDLTGGDTISARALNKGSITFRNTARVVIRCNHLPNIVGTDESVWSRIQLVPFDVVIPEQERDKDLRAKLAREFPGIFNWAYVGLRRYVERGYRFDVPKSVISIMTDYRKKSDVLGAWLEECVESDPKVDGDSCKEIQAEVTSSYMAWASRNGHGVMSAKLLWDRIRARFGFDPVYAGDRGVKYAKGFKLRRGSDNVLALMQEDSDTKDLQIDKLRAQVAALKVGAGDTTSTTRFSNKASRPH